MNNGLKVLLSALVIAGMAALTCTSSNELASGSSSETVVGKMVNVGGTPAGNTKVTLYPDTYDPVAAAPLPAASADTTNDSGEFAIKVPDTSAHYNVLAVQLSLRERSLSTGIVILGTATRVPEDTLTAPGAIKVMLPDSVDNVNGYLYVPGTDIAASLLGNSDSVVLDSVPAGIIPVLYYAVKNSAVRKVIRYAIRVPSGDTVVIRNPEWKYARQLYLNTSATGAAVSGNAYGFPVLIRLTTGNFNFSEANAAGGDFRFTKPDGSLLPYQIDRWDAAGGSAEVWVRADTVFGSSSSQYITMYWGNAAAAAGSNGGAVFAAADGYEAVWHCDSTVSDATGNNHTGTCTGTADTIGIIGRCQKFNGSSYVKISGLLNAPSTVTLAAWASLNQPDVTGGEVVSVGDAVLIRMDDSWKTKGTQGAYCVDPTGGVDSTHSCDRSGRFFQQTGWHYLVYSVDITNNVQLLYIDGTLCCSTNSAIPIVYSGVGTDTYLGKHGNGRTDFDFIGKIDEVHVDKIVRSADWVKLCYMNQRADDKLVEFR